MTAATVGRARLLPLAAPHLALPACNSSDRPVQPEQDYAADLHAAWEFVRDSYAHLDEKRTDWDRVRASFLPRAETVEDNSEFIGLLEEVLEEIYDHHAHLGVNTASSPRLVPSGTDLWAEYRDGVPLIIDVRSRSGAEGAGLRPGVEVLAVNGRSIREVVTDRMPSALEASDPEAWDWALRVALAGHHDQAVEIEHRTGRWADGHEPDIVFLRDNPLEDMIHARDIGWVMSNGRLHQVDALTRDVAGPGASSREE